LAPGELFFIIPGIRFSLLGTSLGWPLKKLLLILQNLQNLNNNRRLAAFFGPIKGCFSILVPCIQISAGIQKVPYRLYLVVPRCSVKRSPSLFISGIRLGASLLGTSLGRHLKKLLLILQNLNDSRRLIAFFRQIKGCFSIHVPCVEISASIQ